LKKREAEIVTSESHLRMSRGNLWEWLFHLVDFELIEVDLRSKFTCTFDNTYLFYCYVKDESLDPFPTIKIQLERLTLSIEAKDYVIFVKNI
jgi:hypothetical protein